MEDEKVIELVDDEGTKERFIFLTSLEHEGRNFAVLTPEEADDEDEEAIIVLELLESDENAEQMELVSVDDDALAEAVFNKYVEMVEEDEEEGEPD
jgi:uncharacterized protein YrzB (UPF0473 family)